MLTEYDIEQQRRERQIAARKSYESSYYEVALTQIAQGSRDPESRRYAKATLDYVKAVTA